MKVIERVPIEPVIEVVRAAGEVIEQVRAVGFDVYSKGKAGPVTEADHAADALLRERLVQIVPAAWLSEETADDPDRLTKDRLWVVDPLDGTKEFVQGVPEYSVAVALVQNGLPILAVVHNPRTKDMFWATRGGGAFRNGTPMHVAEGVRILASRTEVKRGEFEPFGDWDVVPIGSIEYKLALIAAGEAAVTLSRGPKHEWDVCAGALLVEEAGGVATDVLGEPLRFNQAFPKTRGVLAAAPKAWTRAIDLVRRTGVSDRMDEFEEVR